MSTSRTLRTRTNGAFALDKFFTKVLKPKDVEVVEVVDAHASGSVNGHTVEVNGTTIATEELENVEDEEQKSEPDPEPQPEHDKKRKRSSPVPTRVLRPRVAAKLLKPADSDDEDFLPAKPSRSEKKKSALSKVAPKKSLGKGRDILSYFGKLSNGGDVTNGHSEPKSDKGKNKHKEVKVIDAARAAFLYSGLPSAIVKAQQQAVKKKEEDDILETVEFYPKFSHNITIEPNTFSLNSSSEVWPFMLVEGLAESTPTLETAPEFSKFIKKCVPINYCEEITTFCCAKPCPPTKPSRFAKKLDLALTISGDEEDEDSEALPWIEKYPAKRKKKLVVDKPSLHKFYGWLSQWKRDIENDGGVSRKVQAKGTPGSESDFVTSDDECGEFNKKSVLLCGPTGCGKSAMVYVISKSLGFQVVEVNFSSSRSGKEVMQSVEEATLSHRLSDSGAVDERHCLILFKDIDLFEAEEDKAFHTAVSQLIASSVRPIVMTICQPCTLDPKIEKADPLWISVPYPKPSPIVQKILLPILQSETKCDKYDETDLAHMTSVLDSIVRHSNCDIRKSINQTQIACSSKLFTMQRIHSDLSPCQNFGHVSGEAKQEQSNNGETVAINESKAEKRRRIQELEQISKNLEIISDSDILSSFQLAENESEDILTGIRDSLQSNCMQLLNAQTNEKSLGFHKSLAFKSEADISKEEKIISLSEEMNAYVDDVNDFDAKSYVRTIIKTEVLNSVGREAKRNRRLKGYFNRINADFVQRISNTFDFQEHLAVAEANSLAS